MKLNFGKINLLPLDRVFFSVFLDFFWLATFSSLLDLEKKENLLLFDDEGDEEGEAVGVAEGLVEWTLHESMVSL